MIYSPTSEDVVLTLSEFAFILYAEHLQISLQIGCGTRIIDTGSLAPESGERVAPTGVIILDKDSGNTPSLLA